MDTKDTSPAEEHKHEDCHKKNKQRHMIALVTLMFMLGGLTTVGALYFSAADSVNNKDQEIVSLQEEINQLKLINNENQTEIDDIETQVAEDEAVVETFTYEASLANFELELDKSFGIYKTLDAPFEGPGATTILVAKISEDSSSVLDASLQAGSVFIEATFTEEAGGPGDPVEALESRGRVLEQQDDIQFAGKDATVFLQQGLYDTQYVFFESGDFQYQIRYDAGFSDEILEAVEAGLSFN